MIFDPPLQAGTLKRRYKRFLFDATLEDGRDITGSCPNTGSMMGLTSPGSPIMMTVHDNKPSRRYRHALELVHAEGSWVGINTSRPNRLAEEAITAGLIADLADYPVLRREQKYGANSRIDILLENEDGNDPRVYVEVKNVHLMREPGLAEFPDSVTSRGAKHLDELAAMVKAGHRAVMIFLIQRNDCGEFRLCRDLDPAYAAAFDRASAAGVESYAVRCEVKPSGIRPEAQVPILD